MACIGCLVALSLSSGNGILKFADLCRMSSFLRHTLLSQIAQLLACLPKISGQLDRIFEPLTLLPRWEVCTRLISFLRETNQRGFQRFNLGLCA
ncbi:hypothetical protein Aph02nite_10250 [Actinoplanes philippinensis]|uniref:hypothetical protein n=1 Tax=Actinoplanes philippinensis TaxID=35752 RepID=UPI0015A659CB|nr:hypothetical protein [Actinoplanes philippinensis]GIE75075.1 hypothetical protein Aph02nite_10250 [Actinoplanes philippinensis]